MEIAQNISVIIACLTIILGVDAWKREYVGKRNIELAEDVLTLFYQARDAVGRIRNPFSRHGEGETRKAGEYERPDEKELLNRAYVVVERFDKEREIFNKLDVVRYRFMARFGADSKQPFDDLRSIITDIFVSANRLGSHYWQRQGRVQMSETEFQTHLREMHEHEANFWEGAAKKDPVKKRIDEAIEGIEKICRPIIQDKFGVGSLLVIPFGKIFRRK
jgi:hypothetical protein